MRKHKATLFAKRGVVGYGLGHKFKSWVDTGIPSIVVMVEKKLSKAKVNNSDLIPKTIDGFPTDVIETGKIVALERTGKYKPAPGGCSIGHYLITAGTLGAIVRESGTVPPPDPPPPEPPPPEPPPPDETCPIASAVVKTSNFFAKMLGRKSRIYAYSLGKRDVAPEGTRLILSNNHVLADSNVGKIGDPIYQPGPYDGGRAVDKIATLLRFVAINFNGGYNTVDCALALPLSDGLVSDEILEIGRVAGVRDSISIGTAIKKSGRTTELTTGKVLLTDAVVQVDYGGPVAFFEGQIIGGPMSDGGDSGSLCLDSNNMAVGLLFAGSDTVTIFNPISEVIRLLGITF